MRLNVISRPQELTRFINKVMDVVANITLRDYLMVKVGISVSNTRSLPEEFLFSIE